MKGDIIFVISLGICGWSHENGPTFQRSMTLQKVLHRYQPRNASTQTIIARDCMKNEFMYMYIQERRLGILRRTFS